MTYSVNDIVTKVSYCALLSSLCMITGNYIWSIAVVFDRIDYDIFDMVERDFPSSYSLVPIFNLFYQVSYETSSSLSTCTFSFAHVNVIVYLSIASGYNNWPL